MVIWWIVFRIHRLRGWYTNNLSLTIQFVFSQHTDGSEMKELHWLIDQLMHGKIDGFLLDKYSFWQFCGIFQLNNNNDYHDHQEGELRNFLLKQTITTDVPHTGDV